MKKSKERYNIKITCYVNKSLEKTIVEYAERNDLGFSETIRSLIYKGIDADADNN